MRPIRLPAQVKRVRENAFWNAFQNAFEGIIYATRTERNMRIHLVAGALVLFATLYLRLARAYVAVICVTVAAVLALELLNTAIEAVVDLMTVAHHPLAKIAKDAAAGAVLVMSIGAVIVGYLSFYEGIQSAGAEVKTALAQVPVNYVLVTLAIVAIATIFAKAFVGRHGSPLQGGAVSGHAALAFAGATLIALLSQTVLVGLLAYFLAFLVSQSRVEGGIHTALEVFFGGALGAGLSFAIFILIRARPL
ncbi:MAG TPA: diacylglycerol kinase [Candidatus Acidoferrales bacterium]|nr:diacylglycerol kinase [Candidatus Acidoferrales bacterium]